VFAVTEHVPYGDGAYFAVTVASTVGFGDVIPHSGAGRVVAVVLMVTTIPMLGAAFTRLAAAHVRRHVRGLLAEHHRLIHQHISDATRRAPVPAGRPVMFRAGGPLRGVPVFDAAPKTFLADVSEFQPHVNDPAYLAWSKAIVIRAMFGDAHDDAAWYGGARRRALWDNGAEVVLIYQYLVAWQSPAAQAEALIKLLGKLRPGEMPVCDLEEGDGDQAPRLAEWRAVIHDAYPWILSTPSGRAWNYTGLDFALAHNLARPEWLADYTSAEPASPPHQMWQFTSAYPVPGVGPADCSLYRGTVAGLRALITTADHHQQAATRPQPTTAPARPIALEDTVIELDTTVASHPLLIPYGTKTADLLTTAPATAPLTVRWTFLDHAAEATEHTLTWGGADVTIPVGSGQDQARIDVVSGGGAPLAVRFN